MLISVSEVDSESLGNAHFKQEPQFRFCCLKLSSIKLFIINIQNV